MTAISPAQRTVAWEQAHQRLVEHAGHRARLDLKEGELLLDAHSCAVHTFLGYATFEQYAEFLLGYSPRMTQERLRVARCLRELPTLRRALRKGELCWSSVREVTRVAVKETEAEWLEAAKNRSARQVEDLVSGHAIGDKPTDPTRAEARRHVLRFEVAAETYAAFREACGKIRRESDGSLDDDSLLLMMARQILEGPTDEGRSSYQVAVSRCPDCNRSRLEATGVDVEIAPEIDEMVSCDAQEVGTLDGPHVGARASQTIPPAIRRCVLRRDRGRCQVPGCRCSTYVDIHHLHMRSEGGDHNPDRLLVLCAAHHRAVHRGTLLLEGKTAAELVFRHADGTAYGGAVRVETAAACLEARAALRGLGFTEAQARGAIARIRDRSSDAGEMVRNALRLLQPAAWVRETRARYHALGQESSVLCERHSVRRALPFRRYVVPHTEHRAIASATALARSSA